MKIDDLAATADFARRLRVRALRMVAGANASHIGTCLSMADILAVLYGRIMRIDPTDPRMPDRDRCVVSKGHGAAIVYAALAESGFFPTQWLKGFCREDSPLLGHVSHHGVPGVEVSTGSLGHGLSIACGMALAAIRGANNFRVFALLSDGECDEGSTWEAALFAPHHELGNLTAIVDYNKIQSLGTVREVLDLEPFAEKWRAFGWHACEVDGHDLAALDSALADSGDSDGRPRVIIAHTVKGKGVSFMEDKLEWHYRSPNAQQLALAIEEINGDRCG